MTRLFLLLLCLFVLPSHANLLSERPAAFPELSSAPPTFLPVQEAFQLTLFEESADSLLVRFQAAPGYYLYRHAFAFDLKPAELAVKEAQIPSGLAKHDDYFGEVEVYYDTVDVRIPISNPDGQGVSLDVRYQGCADAGLCYPPETKRFTLGLSSVEETPAEQGLSWSKLALFFVAGIGLTLTPCVLPMLPILTGVVLRGQLGGRRGLVLSLAYVLPMAACFALLGALMGTFGAELNLQARLQSPWVLVPFAAFFAVFALAMFGLFELRLPRFISEPLDRLAGKTQGGSILGAAILGVLSSLLVSPCVSAPLAAALLYISSSGDALGGGLQLFALGLGMGTLLVVLGAGGNHLIPKAGAWMVSVRNAFGVLLLAVAVWLLERVLPGSWALALWGIFAGGLGLALLRHTRTLQGIAQRLALALVLLLLAYSASALLGAQRGGSDPLKPWAGPVAHGQWLTFTDAAQLPILLAQAQAAEQPVLLDWYADWCISCKIIEREVLQDPAVVQALAGYQLLRFDLTASTAEQRALLDQYQLFGPPALMLFDRQGQELRGLRIVGEVSSAQFLAKLKQANDQN